MSDSLWPQSQDCSVLGFLVLHYLLEFSQTHVYWVCGAIQPSHTLSPSSPPAFIFPSIRVSSNESAVHIRWPRFFGASASVFSMNSQSWFTLGLTGLISLLSKGLSVFVKTTVWKCQFFGTQLSMVQLSHPYMTTGKAIALTRRTFVSKVMSLLFNMLSRLVIAFLPRSKCLLI